MKFYKTKFFDELCLRRISGNKLTAIYSCAFIRFFKNGRFHNSKNASYIAPFPMEHKECGYKTFFLNGEYYGNEDDFTKKSWRRFIKMKFFL